MGLVRGGCRHCCLPERANLHIDHVVALVTSCVLLHTRVSLLLWAILPLFSQHRAALGRRLRSHHGHPLAPVLPRLVLLKLIGPEVAVLGTLVHPSPISALLSGGLDHLIGPTVRPRRLLGLVSVCRLLDCLLGLGARDHIHVLEVLEDALLLVQLRVQLLFLLLHPESLLLLNEPLIGLRVLPVPVDVAAGALLRCDEQLSVVTFQLGLRRLQGRRRRLGLHRLSSPLVVSLMSYRSH